MIWSRPVNDFPVNEVVVIVGLVLLAVLMERLWRRQDRKLSARAKREYEDVRSMGEVVPDSLHPRISADRCIGSGACVTACPEKLILGVIHGKAQLLNPLACIGHSACMDACPVNAIELVFGTATRGVELPRLDANFETTKPGVYIVGELGGMGLISNAVAQGVQAGAHIANTRRRGGPNAYDAVVVGAGPSGVATMLRLKAAGLRALLLERESYGGTIAHYPRRKLTMTTPLDLPLYGKVRSTRMTKEELLELFDNIRSKTELDVRTGELVSKLRQVGELWELESTSGNLLAANVVLALGRRGAPRKLEVPGEEASKVYYRLLEPEVFAGQHVMVVGGGNSAVESALALIDQGGCASVSISYRRTAFARCREENRRKIDDAIGAGRVRSLLPSEIVSIGTNEIELKNGEQRYRVPNDAVIVQIGGTSPAELLASFGIETVTKYGER